MEKDITAITPEQLLVINEAAAILQALSTHDIMSTGDILAQNEENVDMKRIETYEHKIFYSSGNWYVVMPDGKRIRRKKREDIEKIVIDIQKEREEAAKEEGPPDITAEEIFKLWQAEGLKTKVVKGGTVRRDWGTYNRYLKGTEIAARNVKTTTRKEWTTFLQNILKNRPTAKEFARIKGVIKDILHWAEDHGCITYTAEDVIIHVRVRKNTFSKPDNDPAKEVYLPDELKALKEYCLNNPDPYTRCILMGIITGTRPGECAPCHIDDVDISKRTLTIRRTETGADENGNRAETIHEGAKTDAGVRIVSIPECNVSWVEEVIEAAHQYSDTWLFPQEPGKWKKRYTGQRIRTSQLRRHLRDICENELHIEYKSPHKLRKTYASILAANNVPDTMRIAQMGHTDIKTTKQFYEFDRETNAEKAQKLGEIEELRLLFEDKGTEMSPKMSPEDMLQKKEDPEMP